MMICMQAIRRFVLELGFYLIVLTTVIDCEEEEKAYKVVRLHIFNEMWLLLVCKISIFFQLKYIGN